MANLDAYATQLEAFGTGGSRFFTAAAISLIILCAQQAPSPRQEAVSHDQTVGSATEPQSLQIEDIDVARQISRVYESLLRHQVDLDGDIKAALYENLADLYV